MKIPTQENLSNLKERRGNPQSNFNFFENKEYYATPDLNLAAALWSLDFKILKLINLQDKRKITRDYFVFERTPQLLKTVEEYWIGGIIKIEPRVYSNSIKNLKTRIYDYENNML